MEDRIARVTTFILAACAAAAALGYILYYDLGLSRLQIRHGALGAAAVVSGALVAKMIEKSGK
jgi:hypothetical protein